MNPAPPAPLAPSLRPADPEHPCRAWSAHAESLAPRISRELAQWPDHPGHRVLVAEGQLVEVRTGVLVPAPSLASMPDRAIAIGCALGADVRASHVIASASALWVLLGGAPLLPIQLLTTARPTSLGGVTVRQAPLSPGDVETIGGCPVTVPARSATDLLRFAAEDEVAIAWCARLLASGHAREREITARLEGQDGMPHLRRARQRWDAVRGGLLRAAWQAALSARAR